MPDQPLPMPADISDLTHEHLPGAFVPLDFVPQDAAGWSWALSDPWWRICSGQLYKILTKDDDSFDALDDASEEDFDADDLPEQSGVVQPFMPNINQILFLIEMHDRNVILKARQLGFTTLIAILWLDHCLFVSDQRAAIIAHTKKDASSIFRDKVRFAYDRLPEALREAMPLKVKSAEELMFGHNGSSIKVAVSVRSGTINRLHVSEMGKIAAKFPAKAVEIVTGSLPAVPKSGVAIIESTAEGREGEFFNIADRAEKIAQSGIEARPGQWKFHFFPWWKDPGYQIDPAGVRISLKQHEYFDKIEADQGVSIGMRQRAWYVNKLQEEFSGDQEKMWREMPSTSAECWARSTSGTFLYEQMAAARREGRITSVPHRKGLLVHTFWDIGAGDGTGIWLMQQVGLASHFIGYIEDWGKGYDHYVMALRRTGYLFGGMYLPHDAMHKRQMADKIAAPLDMLSELAPDWRWNIVPRAHDFQAAITLLRSKMPEAWFDEDACAAGIEHLDLYKKVFNTRMGVYTDEPEKHDGHSEAPDALRQWAQGFDPSHITTIPGAKKKATRRRATGATA